jgi:hypothetical protein
MGALINTLVFSFYREYLLIFSVIYVHTPTIYIEPVLINYITMINFKGFIYAYLTYN